MLSPQVITRPGKPSVRRFDEPLPRVRWSRSLTHPTGVRDPGLCNPLNRYFARWPGAITGHAK